MKKVCRTICLCNVFCICKSNQKETGQKQTEQKETEQKEKEQKETEQKETEKKETEQKETEQKETEQKGIEQKKAERKKAERKEISSQTFFEAAKGGNLKKLMNVKKFISSSVNSTNDRGETPLTVACKLGNLEVVRFLVEHCQADVNQVATIFASDTCFSKYCCRGTPLHAAVISGNLDLVLYLVNEQHADVNATTENSFNNGGNTPLHHAVYFLKRNNKLDIVNFLLMKGCNMYCLNSRNLLAWQMSSEMGPELKQFIRLGFDPNHVFGKGRQNFTIAHMWAKSQQETGIDIIHELLKVGADFSLKDENGLTPLMLAAIGENGIINEMMFQRIFNGTFHKMNDNEKIAALELIGARYIINHWFGHGINRYWKLAVELRTRSSTNIIDSSLLANKFDEMRENIITLGLQYEQVQHSPKMRNHLISTAVQTMASILGPESKYVQNAIKPVE